MTSTAIPRKYIPSERTQGRILNILISIAVICLVGYLAVTLWKGKGVGGGGGGGGGGCQSTFGHKPKLGAYIGPPAVPFAMGYSPERKDMYGALRGPYTLLTSVPTVPTIDGDSFVDNDFMFFGNSCNPLGYSVLGPIKDQGQCGSCWCFGTTAGFEAFISIKENGRYVSLSEQYTLNCPENGDQGCGGGLFQNMIPTVSNNGMVTEKAVPYNVQALNSGNALCVTKPPAGASFVVPKGAANKLAAFYVSGSKSIRSIKRLLCRFGPLVTAIDAADPKGTSVQDVASSPTSIAEPGTNYDHQVVLVGWGKSPSGEPYWIIRNSWGTRKGSGTVGNKGYFALKATQGVFQELAAITNLNYDRSAVRSRCPNVTLNG